MASDDVFRGRATIEDRMSPALRNIRNEWMLLNKGMQLGSARREVDGLRGSLRGIGNEITGATLPALSRLGLAGGGVVAAVVGVAAAVKGYSEKIQDLGIASKELGLSVRNLRAFELAAGSVRINPAQALQGLETFKKNAEDFQLRIGGLRDELRSLGAGDVVEAIRAAKDPLDQMRIAFARMEELQRRNPAVAKRFAEAMFGSVQFARMGWDEFRRSFEKVGELTEDEIRRAERLNKQFLELGASVEKLKQSATGVLLPGVSTTLKEVNAILGALNRAEEWVRSKTGTTGGDDLMGDLATKMITGKGVDVGGDPMGNDYARGMKSGPTSDQMQLRLPRLLDPRRREDTEEGTKKGVEDGMEKFFQKHSSNLTGGGGGFMNAAFGGTSGSLPSGGGRWGGGGFELKGLGNGASDGQAIPAPSPGSGSGGGAAPPAGGKSANAQRIYNELRRLGHSHEQASAALGHAQHESGFNPSVRGDGGTAHGFWQHRGSRWALAQKLAKDAGTSPYSPEQAARHFDYELRHGEKGAGSRYFTSKSTRDAVTALNGYERFAGWQRGQPGRYSSAEGFARRMQETGETPAAVTKNRDMIGGQPVSEADKANVVGGGGGFNDRWNDRIDGALGGRNMSSPTGTVNLNVTAPAGTKVEGKSEGMFKDMSIKRYRQMGETGLSE